MYPYSKKDWTRGKGYERTLFIIDLFAGALMTYNHFMPVEFFAYEIAVSSRLASVIFFFFPLLLLILSLGREARV